VVDLKPVYLLTGADRPKIQRAVERLKGHFDPASVEQLSAEEASGEEAVAACNALGLFGGGGRLVLVTSIDGHRNQDGRLVGGWKKADVDAVVAYLTNPSPGTVLALVGEEVRKDSAVAKASAKAGDVLVFDTKTKSLAPWVGEQFKQLGARAQPEACQLLVELVGDNTDELRLEVEKLALAAGADEIGSELVEEMVWPRRDAPPWELTDAWGKHDIAGVLAASERLLRRRGTPTGLVWSLADHVALVRACRAFAAEGVSVTEATKRLKRRSEFPVRKAYAQAETWDEDELQSALVRLADLDEALKGGSRLPDELEFARALVEVTRGRG
jgi:DNA polymerase III delta subunit